MLFLELEFVFHPIISEKNRGATLEYAITVCVVMQEMNLLSISKVRNGPN